MANIKMLIAGAGAAAVAGAAIVTQTLRDDGVSEGARDAAGYEVCLKSNLAFFEGVSAKCYAQADLYALRTKQVVDGQGAPASLTMTHPSDASVAPAEIRTCAEYNEMTSGGWYAATSLEIRREGFFIRACGALAALAEAQPADRSFFNEGSPDEKGVAAISASMRFGESAIGAEAVRVEKSGSYEWRITAGAMTITLQEFANADFDNDGIEEILAFAAGAPSGGSAAYYETGLIEKDAGTAAVAFTPLTLGRRAASGAGG
jgi:hypothetical protein